MRMGVVLPKPLTALLSNETKLWHACEACQSFL
jgi:hypothetical protein